MILDYLPAEKALLGNLSIDELSPEERDFCVTYRPVFEIGRMAGRMAQGYYAHKVAIEVARDTRAHGLVSTDVRSGQAVPVGDVTRKDGTGHVYDIHHYLAYAQTNSEMAVDLERIWIIGSLISVGDALDKRGYLTRAPLLELVRHLRNGVAHGNAFDIRDKKRLSMYPAHNRGALVKTAEFEITPNLDGQAVLFDFMGPGDVLDVLQSVETYLTRVRERARAGELDGLLKAAADHP